MRCLVTGGGGFIGNALTKRLIEEGNSVVSFLHNSKPKNTQYSLDYFSGSISNINNLKTAFKNIDMVFHCAAFVKDYGSKKKFYKINYEGTKNIIKACDFNDVKRLIFLGHINYDLKNQETIYSKTKRLAEQYLLEKNRLNDFPVVIIRPGNVFGPNAKTWVLRPVNAIIKNRISLINNGNGIFHHTYIDNLLDALVSSMNRRNIIGEVIDITDGDNNTTWRHYFNDLSEIVIKKTIKKNISENSAMRLANLMILINKVLKIEPWITPTAVNILTNNRKISIQKARKLLDYKPKIDYNEALIRIKKWLEENILIKV